jgi:hypothetical protein
MKFENLPISKIELDKNNPRIAHVLRMYANVKQEDLYLALGVGEPGGSEATGPSFHSLKEAIRTHKGVIHPILVNKISGGGYITIEGNTRLAIYHDFYRNKVEGDWSTIPCIVYENLSAAEVDAIRLQAHLVGVRAWAPYAKAKYLAYLRNCKHLTWNQIVDYCGGKKKEAEELIAAYDDMETYYRAILGDDSSFDETRFSAFVELQKPKIKESILTAGFNLKDFSKWVQNRIFSRLENVRRLPAILTDKKAKEAFLTKGDKMAVAILDAALVQADHSNLTLAQLARLLAERLRKINLEEIKKYKDDLSALEPAALLDAKEELVTLFNLIKSEDE